MTTAGATVADLIQDCRAHLEGDYRPTLDVLATALTDTTGTSVVLTDRTELIAGSLLTIDTEDMYVRSWSKTSKLATVIRGHRGSTAATHALGASVEVEPRFSAAQIMRALRDEIRSWPPSLYKVVEATATVGAYGHTVAMPSTLLGSYGLIDVSYRSDLVTWDSSTSTSQTNALYRLLPYASIIRSATDLGFSAAEAIDIGEQVQVSTDIRVVAAMPFDLTTFVAGTNVVDATGLQVQMLDIPPLGAAARLVESREIPRTQRSSQGEPRQSQEVPPLHTQRAGIELRRLADQRIGREAARLSRMWPVRFT